MRLISCFWLLVASLALLPVTSLHAADGVRVTRGLKALYTFDTGRANLVQDRSGVNPRLDLKIDKSSGVQWKNGVLVVRSSTKISSVGPAKKIIDAVKRSSSLTIEAWVKPRDDRQTGPARIVSLSSTTLLRNFTLGQDGKRYDVRLRTTATSNNGMPSTATPEGTLKTRLTHVVYTRDTAGNARIYINGKQETAKKVAGKLSNWDNGFRLILANEATGDRSWLGEFHLVAVYSRALSAGEVARNFKAGAASKPDPKAALALATERAQRNFETNIAPLLARSCLECHDSSSKKGRLDLSRKNAALLGGKSGKAIVAGSAADSLLWKKVASGKMPKKGLKLSPQEKTLLRKWIDGGAIWSAEVIDPAVYAHDRRAADIWVQRLTLSEYIETVKSAVGVDVVQDARRILPPDLRADGFSNTAYNLNVDLKHVEAYARLAEIIVGRMDVVQFAEKFSKSRKLSPDKGIRKLVEGMGKRLLRGPLDERELTTYSGIATTVASTGGDYKEAVSTIIEAMLQSPRFIYRIESQRGDGTALPVGEYELASRLSYIIWGGPPDKELMRAADAGELTDRSRCAEQVARMLKDSRAIERSSQFIAEWLNLARLDNLKPDPKMFPKWDAKLAADMREETLAFFKHVAWEQKRPLADLLNAQVTFASPRLAKHYGLVPKGAEPNKQAAGMSRYDLSRVPSRGGLLTQGSLLTIGGDEASMVTRGLFVFHELLRGVVKDPPPCVDTTPVPTRVGLTQRSIAEARIANVACGVCHAKFEPLAFGLEKFDGLGTFYDVDEHGNKLRDDGKILFPGNAKPVSYKSSAELMNLLTNSQRVRESLTWKVTQFALSRPLGAADARAVAAIHRSAQKDGGTYASLITAIVLSDLVQLTRTEKDR